MIINYIHGLNGHENGNASQLVSKALDKIGVDFIMSAPSYMVTKPEYVKIELNSLNNKSGNYIAVASSLGAFYTMQYVDGIKILVNPALPQNIEKLNDPSVSDECLSNIKKLWDDFRPTLESGKLGSDIYIICGTRDTVAPNAEYYKKVCQEGHFYSVDMEHKMEESGAAQIAEIIKSFITNKDPRINTVVNRLEEITAEENLDKPLCEMFNVNRFWFSRRSIDDLQLSTRAYNCLSRYMDPPLAQPTGCHWSVDELLEIKVGELKSIRNLGERGFIEILEKTKDIISN